MPLYHKQNGCQQYEQLWKSGVLEPRSHDSMKCGKITVENIIEAVMIRPWSSTLRHVLNETFIALVKSPKVETAQSSSARWRNTQCLSTVDATQQNYTADWCYMPINLSNLVTGLRKDRTIYSSTHLIDLEQRERGQSADQWLHFWIGWDCSGSR